MPQAPIINIDQVDLESYSHGRKFEGKSGPMGKRIGSRKLGCRLMVVPAGKRGYPYHNHRANEEMFYVLEGTGKYRIGDNEYHLRKGDLVAAPAGGRETSHQIINDSGSPLKYLAISTMIEPDVIEYPETGKIGIVAGKAPGGEDNKDQLIHFTLFENGVDYWYGES